MQSPFTFVAAAHTCMHAHRSAEIVLSIHWSHLRIFYFLHHTQVLHCLKVIRPIIEMCVHIYAYLELAGATCPSFQPIRGVWWAFSPTLWVFELVPTAFESAKIVMSIHWTLPSNFIFLHHSQILHSLKTIAKYRNVHACLCTLRSHICTYGICEYTLDPPEQLSFSS